MALKNMPKKVVFPKLPAKIPVFFCHGSFSFTFGITLQSTQVTECFQIRHNCQMVLKFRRLKIFRQVSKEKLNILD